MKKISIVVPCYNEDMVLNIFYHEIMLTFEKMKNVTYEIVFVDDGSKDTTLKKIKMIAADNQNVKFISFSRNFGKEAAIYAGLKNSSGDYITVMDADLQDPPSLIPEMFKILSEGDADIVGSCRCTRKGESKIRSFFANLFYRLINKISDTEIRNGARDFQMMKRKVVDAVLSMGEYNRFSKGIFGWIGFRKTWIEYENVERAAGTTKWSFWKLFIYAVNGIVGFSSAPLTFVFVLGIVLVLLALIGFGVIAVQPYVVNDYWIYTNVLALFTGIILSCIGVLGKYISDIHKETKSRPVFIITETNVDWSE